MEVTNFAPVIIPTLCRYEHFRRCITSLSLCKGADKTDLFIALDYPSKESHWDGYKNICEYVPHILGFKSVNVVKREKNFGPVENSNALRKELLKTYDRYIFSEDDNEFSPNFLEYINKGLEKYKDNPQVMAICGFNYPFLSDIPNYTKNAMPLQFFSAWGVGHWREKSDKVRKECVHKEFVDRLLHSYSLVFHLFRKKQYITIHRLLFRGDRGTFSDLMWRVYLALNNSFCIFPSISKLRNHGFDGSGTNCMSSNPHFARMVIDRDTTFDFDEFEIKKYSSIHSKTDKFLHGSFHIRVGAIIEYLFYRWFGLTILRGKAKNIGTKKRI